LEYLHLMGFIYRDLKPESRVQISPPLPHAVLSVRFQTSCSTNRATSCYQTLTSPNSRRNLEECPSWSSRTKMGYALPTHGV
jgi:hypothetical protein